MIHFMYHFIILTTVAETRCDQKMLGIHPRSQGGLLSTAMEAEKRDPGNEVAWNHAVFDAIGSALSIIDPRQNRMPVRLTPRSVQHVKSPHSFNEMPVRQLLRMKLIIGLKGVI